jgi:hypothetical protein
MNNDTKKQEYKYQIDILNSNYCVTCGVKKNNNNNYNLNNFYFQSKVLCTSCNESINNYCSECGLINKDNKDISVCKKCMRDTFE